MNKNLSTEPEQKSQKKRPVSFFTRQHTALFGVLVYDICPNNEKGKLSESTFSQRLFFPTFVMDLRFPKG